eukprot:3605718-Ditylum_brightwellii.AAC.1
MSYKLITLLITDRVYDHLIHEGILPLEQKGTKRRYRGRKDRLLLNKLILECTHISKHNLSVLWIDYQKAYDSVPHLWIKQVLRLYKISPIICNFIETLIPFWHTQLNLHHAGGTISTTDIAGSELGKGSDDIVITFGLDKCAVLTIKRRKSKPTDILPDIPWLDKDYGYHYLGVYKGADFLTDCVKKATPKEYISQVCSILKAQSMANSTMTTICAYAVPVMRYTSGIIRWTKIELRQLDKKTRHIRTANGCLYPKSGIKRLYLHCNKGGHGLTSVKDTHTHECTALAQYIQKSDDPLTQLFCDTPSPTQ